MLTKYGKLKFISDLCIQLLQERRFDPLDEHGAPKSSDDCDAFYEEQKKLEEKVLTYSLDISKNL